MAMQIGDFLSRLQGVSANGDGKWVARCPAHGDKHPSLSVATGNDGRILVHCHVGCSVEAIVEAMGLKVRDLMPDAVPMPALSPAPTAAAKRKGADRKWICDYVYHDVDGNVLYKASRYAMQGGGKTFTISHPDPSSERGWVYGLSGSGIQRVPYHLPEVVEAAKNGREIVICEGEKDVDNVRALGITATCNVGGAGKWAYQFPDGWGKWFAGASGVTIIADHDPEYHDRRVYNRHTRSYDIVRERFCVGQRHALDVAEKLRGQGFSGRIKLMVMPDVDGSSPKDFTEWRDAMLKAVPGCDLKKEFWRAVNYSSDWLWDFSGDNAPVEDDLDDKGAVVETGRFGAWRSHGDDRVYEITFEHNGRFYPWAFHEGDTVGAMIASAWAVIHRAWKSEDGKQERSDVPTWRVMAWCASVWLLMRGSFYWDENERTFERAMYFDRDPKTCRLMRIFDDEFLAFVGRAAELDDVDPKKGDMGKIMGVVKQIALSDDYSTGVMPSNLWDRREDSVYISSGDDQMYRIRDGRVQAVQNGTDGVLFLRGKTLSPWKLVDGHGVDPFTESMIFKGASWEDKVNGPIVVCSWLLYAFACSASKPPLLITGPAGSGKTRMAKAMKEILSVRTNGRIDLSVQQMEKGDKGLDAFWAAANDGRFEVFDNLDQKIEWASDALQIAATDGQTKRRTLYTNYGVSILKANSYLVFTSNNPVMSTEGNGGMADRLVTVRLLRNDRKSLDKELTADIKAHRDQYMTWMARTIASAVADRAPVDDTINARHPDFGEFAIRVGRVLGRETEFANALGAIEIDKLMLPIQSDPLGHEILRSFAFHNWDWKFTTTDLVTSIIELMGDEKDDKTSSFISARRVGGVLKKYLRQFRALLNLDGPRLLHGVSVYVLSGRRVNFDLLGVGWVGSNAEFSKTIAPVGTGAHAYGFARNGENIPPTPPMGASGAGDMSVSSSLREGEGDGCSDNKSAAAGEGVEDAIIF